MKRNKLIASMLVYALAITGLYGVFKLVLPPSMKSSPNTQSQTDGQIQPSTGNGNGQSPATQLSDVQTTANVKTQVNPNYIVEEKINDVSNHVVAKVSSGTDVEKLAQTVKAEIIRKGPLDYVTLALPKDSMDTTMEQLKRSPGVLNVSPVRILKKNEVKAAGVSVTDKYYTHQWGMSKASVPQAWNLGATGSGVTVAVIDTGVDLNHPDLKANLLPGYNALSGLEGSTVAQDKNGHGTHVAGIIAAGLNGIGVVGVAYQAKILPIKALTDEGAGYDTSIADAIVWAADHGAKIINLSLGSPEESDMLRDALVYASEKGCLIVAAAGNRETSTYPTMITYPASDPRVLAVAASDANDKIANFSLPGPSASITAPGVSIVSSYWQNGTSGYASIDGTSMASPFVAGVAALVWGVQPNFTPQQIRTTLESSTLHMGSDGRNLEYGFGRVNAYWAVRFAKGGSILTSPATLDWAGGVVQGGTGNTTLTVDVPPRAFGTDPTTSISLSVSGASGAPAFPSGIQPFGDAISIAWNGTVKQALGLTMTTAGTPPDTGQIAYIYRWTGDRWIIVGGGGINASTIKSAITEAGIYRLGYTTLPANRRIAGSDRIETSILVSQSQFPNGAETVVLANASNFPDALAGVPLAYKLHAPILLISGTVLPDPVSTELQRLSPKNIILLGGTGVIAKSVEDQLKAGFSVKRIGGSDRYGTAAQIALELGNIGKAVVVNGSNFPDAITMGSIAAQQGMPILLTEGTRLSPPTDAALRQLMVNQTLVTGGEGAISTTTLNALPSPTRMAGKDRYATAAAVLQSHPPQGNLLFLATGENFPDALTGGVLAALNRSHVVIVSPYNLSSAQSSVIQAWQVQNIYTLGGSSVVPDSVVMNIQTLVQ